MNFGSGRAAGPEFCVSSGHTCRKFITGSDHIHFVSLCPKTQNSQTFILTNDLWHTTFHFPVSGCTYPCLPSRDGRIYSIKRQWQWQWQCSIDKRVSSLQIRKVVAIMIRVIEEEEGDSVTQNHLLQISVSLGSWSHHFGSVCKSEHWLGVENCTYNF